MSLGQILSWDYTTAIFPASSHVPAMLSTGHDPTRWLQDIRRLSHHPSEWGRLGRYEGDLNASHMQEDEDEMIDELTNRACDC